MPNKTLDRFSVVFDPQIFSIQEYGGISRYLCALATELSIQNECVPRIVSPLYINTYLRMLPANLKIGRYIRAQRGTGKLIQLNPLMFRAIASWLKPQIIHETYYSLKPLTTSRSAKRVLTVYDMIHERCPQNFPRDDRTAVTKAMAIKRAEHLLCISEYTKRDLMELLDVPEEKITVTHLASYPLPQTNKTASDLAGFTPYLLYVGQREGYKNFEGFLRAYAASAWLCKEFRLVCFGGQKLKPEELALIHSLGLPEGAVMQIGGGDEVLAALYRGATAFVYPSYYEGFGIPPLEAMSADCPVICSNATSIPEVVGNAGAYFSATEVESIRDTLEQTLQSPQVLANLIAAGRERREHFSWRRCAEETLDVYRGQLG